ncbi:MAG: IS630 family transposase [Acidobacteria bacterium]|nr:IS630 family transposase [Acidobacteriota bacterium]
MLFVTIASESECQALRDLTRQAAGRVALRALMVLWSAARVPIPEIASRLHCRPKTVRKWLRRFEREGTAGLLDLPRAGRPRADTAVARQAVWAQAHQPPSCFGYVAALWTIAALTRHLAGRCSLRLSAWKVRELLRSLRYRFTRPKHAPRKVDPEREQVQQALGRRIAEARSAGAHVLVEDETDIRLFPVLRRMWLVIGEQLRLQAPLQNQKRTIFGAIDIETGAVFYRVFGRKRTLEMVGHLGDLLAAYGGEPLLVVLDHASIHKSRLLREWLSLHPQVELAYLPRYGGHRDNPVEKLWWHLKGTALANRCCSSINELVAAVERYFSELTPEKVFQLVA